MKNKILILLMVCGIMVAGGGCGLDNPYNRIKIIRNGWSSDNVNIEIDNDVKFKDFTKEYTEDGCTVTIHYTK